jgi:hypothetical protein
VGPICAREPELCVGLDLGGTFVVIRGRIKTTMQVSDAAVSLTIESITGASHKQMRESYRKSDGLGDVAVSFFVSRSLKSNFSAAAAATTTTQ